MAAAEASALFTKGMEALQHNHVYLARTCFELATEQERSPSACSYLALCQAQTRGTFDEAAKLAREAVDLEPENPQHYLNLGRVYLLANKRSEAIDIFRQGMRQGSCDEIISELERLGTRRPPPVQALSRNHPVNKYLGMLLARLGLR